MLPIEYVEAHLGEILPNGASTTTWLGNGSSDYPVGLGLSYHLNGNFAPPSGRKQRQSPSGILGKPIKIVALECVGLFTGGLHSRQEYDLRASYGS